MDLFKDEPTYTVRVKTNDSAGIQLMLHESDSKFGGSLFHIEWSVYDPRISPQVEEVEYREQATFPRRVFSITACTVQDHFNGDYSICCPRPKHGKYGCHKLEIVRYYQKFQVYRVAAQASMTPVYSTEWCPQDATVPMSLLSHKHFPPCTSKDLSPLTTKGQWLRVDGKLKWVSTQTNCMAPILDGYPIHSCFERMRSFTIMGDSHLRIYSKYFLNKLFSQHRVHTELGYVKDYTQSEKFKYFWCQDDLAERLHDRYLNPEFPWFRKMTKNDVLVLTTGSWALMAYPVTQYLSTTIPHTLDVLAQIK